MGDAQLHLGWITLKTLSDEDPYKEWLSGNYRRDSRQLRNFVQTHFTNQEDLIFADVGANIGFTSIVLQSVAPGTHIHAFEPSERFSTFSRRIQQLTRISPLTILLSARRMKKFLFYHTLHMVTLSHTLRTQISQEAAAKYKIASLLVNMQNQKIFNDLTSSK